MSKAALRAERQKATREWTEQQEVPSASDFEDDDDISSLAESSIIESSDGDYETETDADLDRESKTLSTQLLGTKSVASDMSTVIENLQDLLNATNSVQTVDNVNIENSTNVHIGNITNINDNVNIENSSNVHIGNITNINGNIQIIRRIKRRSTPKQNSLRSTSPTPTKAGSVRFAPPKAFMGEEREERVRRDAFIDRIKFKIPKELCAIIPRSTWVAQLPMEEYDYIPEPVEYVIISHTATESSEKQAINIRIIRDVQCFHIESREWNDIAYNFLVGCDGNVYEGRGWGVVGAHTMGYNTMSLGISFIGCFMRTLPSEAALNACKNLLKRGVEEGHLASAYKLICHCQCRSTESPGRKLYEEIQKWEHFYNIGDEEYE